MLEARMSERGVTRADIARALPIAESQVSRIFALIRPMTVGELAMICDYLGLRLADVFAEADL